MDLNRELVQTQEQQRELAELLVQGSEQDVLNFIRSLRQQVGAPASQPAQQQAGQAPTRPMFPGGQPGEAQNFSTQNLADYYQTMQRAAQQGFPIDNLESSYQLWDSIPDQAWQALAFDLIRGAF